MRNLKKILALVLVLVMSFSLVSVASAKFEDSDKVNAKFATAVEVLNGLKVFQGYEDGTFNPTGAITRAEVAAIIYRIDTGDVAGNQVQIYSDYNKFDDVKSTAWYAGYVNYCANALYIRGYDEHTFGPNDKVTGYQALAMILRVVGYDKNGEFSGSAWQIETAKYAQRLGLTQNVDVNTLGVPATRELVAELLFRAIWEEKAYQVDYNLLQNYYKVAEPIGKDRFGLANDLAGTDEWGRPYTGWTSKGTPIVVYNETPIKTYDKAVDKCTIVNETGVKGTVGYWVNGVQKTNGIELNTHHETHTLNGKVGAQGTVVEVYSDRVIEIDTYLAVVTGTVKAAYDKNGHMYRTPFNTFAIFGAPGAAVALDDNGDELFNGAKVLYKTVAGNDYTNGDFWLVNYNEKSGKVYPYAVPGTVAAKQTYIWWNAEKHTLDKDPYMDNANYELDYAGYDKEDTYTWFFDTYGNVIGSTEIVTRAAAKTYVIVLGAQWMHTYGADGYAQAEVYYLDGTVKTEKIAKVGDAVAHDVNYKEADFSAGEFSTTWNYNTNTFMSLYEVVKSGANGLELKAVTTDLDLASMKDGVSQFAPGVYADNNTVYYFYNKTTKSIDVVPGYDNLPMNYKNLEDVDVIVNELTKFAQIVYVPVWEKATTATTTPDDVVVNKYVYITGDAMNYKLKDQFALLNVIDAAGSTDPLYFAFNYAGNEAATEAALNEIIALYQDKLCQVQITNGKVTKIAPIALDGKHEPADELKMYDAMFVGADEFYFISTGVMILEDGTALNVNDNTVIISDGKVGTAINNMDYVYGSNLYVVYDGTTAKAIFVTNTVETVKVNNVEMTMAAVMVQGLTADDFSDVSASFTYEVEKDATIDVTSELLKAAIVEAVENGTALTLIDGLHTNDTVTVTVDTITMMDKLVGLAKITVRVGSTTKTVEVVIFFAEKAAQ